MNSDDFSPRRRRRMERLARAAEGWGKRGDINPRVATSFGLLALAARCGGAELRAPPTPTTVDAGETTLDLRAKGA